MLSEIASRLLASMIRWTEESRSQRSAAMESELAEEEEDDVEYVLITAVVFREDCMWETEFYIEAEEHAKFDDDDRSLIALCIRTFDTIIDESLEE